MPASSEGGALMCFGGSSTRVVASEVGGADAGGSEAGAGAGG